MFIQIDYLADHVESIPTLARWHHAEWARIVPHFTVADRLTRLEARARRGGIPTGFVALVDGSVAGMASLVECDLESHAHLSPWLASVLVAPEQRGRGIGAALSERAAEEAQRFGFTRVYLFTFDKQTFYERLGWSVLEPAKFMDHPVSVMVRDLSPLLSR